MNKLNQLTEITQCTVCGNKIPMVYAFEAWCAECAQGFDGNEVTTISQFTAEDMAEFAEWFSHNWDLDFKAEEALNQWLEERRKQ